MIDLLIKGVIAAGVAATTYLAADAVTESVTGKHIHEHLAEIWTRFVNKIESWINAAVGKAHVLLAIAKDDMSVNGKRVMRAVGFIENKEDSVEKITEEKLSSEEVESILGAGKLKEREITELEDDEMSYYALC